MNSIKAVSLLPVILTEIYFFFFFFLLFSFSFFFVCLYKNILNSAKSDATVCVKSFFFSFFLFFLFHELITESNFAGLQAGSKNKKSVASGFSVLCCGLGRRTKSQELDGERYDENCSCFH